MKDIADISEAVELAEAVYLPAEQSERMLKQAGFSEVAHIHGDRGQHVLICGSSRAVWVVFCGTNDLLDVRADLKWWPVKIRGGGRVHRGFRAYWEAADLWGPMMDHLRRLADRPLYLVGHSLGAAGAQLAALWCCNGWPERKAKVITFGGPHVGTRGWCRQFEAAAGDFVRITNAMDPVTFLPAWPFYRHPRYGRHLHLDPQNRLHVNPGWKRMRSLERGLVASAIGAAFGTVTSFSLLRGLQSACNLQDHGIVNYRARWEEWKANR